jgi:hypothetical protein
LRSEGFGRLGAKQPSRHRGSRGRSTGKWRPTMG